VSIPDPGAASLGPEQQSGDRSFPVRSPPVDFVSELRHIGGVAVGHEMVDAVLRLVTTLASATVDGADGVSVSLQRHGRMTTVASSNETVLRMDGHQYETGQGPCLAAAAEGHWFHVESLAGERRWPAFIPRAIDEGIASILSTPLLVADRPLGALNIYSGRDHAFGADQQELAALFATQVSGILADAGADTTDEEMAARITDALDARAVIARAQGVLMAREGITGEAATATLFRSARMAEVTVRQLADEIVASTAVPVDREG
jgi:GAF domain-containing protein